MLDSTRDHLIAFLCCGASGAIVGGLVMYLWLSLVGVC